MIVTCNKPEKVPSYETVKQIESIWEVAPHTLRFLLTAIALNPYQVTYCIKTNAENATPSQTGQKMNEQASQPKNDLINSCFLLTSVASCSCRSQFPFLPNWNKGKINMSLRCIKFVLKAWTLYSNNTENWTTFIRNEFNIYAYYSFFDWGQSSLNKINFLVWTFSRNVEIR